MKAKKTNLLRLSQISSPVKELNRKKHPPQKVAMCFSNLVLLRTINDKRWDRQTSYKRYTRDTFY